MKQDRSTQCVLRSFLHAFSRIRISAICLFIIDDVPYLKAMFERGLAQNEVLTSGKLLLLLERYMGESIQLPAHEGVDDTVYGSLAVYRREIVEELTCWVKSRSAEELDAAMNIAVDECGDQKNVTKYQEAWNEIYAELFQL